MFDRILKNYDNIFEAIEYEILRNYKNISKHFDFDENDKEIKIFLKKLARSDRKRFNTLKQIPRRIGSVIINNLLSKNIIQIEKSREIKPKSTKHHKIKKELRHYQVQDKIHFKNNFTRFWFRFCEPNLELLDKNEFETVLNLIKQGFELYCSLPFELACMELLAKELNIQKELITSYWDKENEIDIFVESDGFTVVGEAKYKDRKICKNVLNILQAKCKRSNLNPNLIALFSKSGFSNELLNLKNDKILLFEINDFKDIYE